MKQTQRRTDIRPLAQRGGGSRTEKKSESMFSRLKAPVGFDDRPYRCCCFRPHHKMVCVFTISLLLGVAMVGGGTFSIVAQQWIYLWLLGGVIKLGGATLCMLAVMRPTRNYILAYLTETVLEIVLIFLGMILLIMLMMMDAGQLRWNPMEGGENSFSSKKLYNSLRKGANAIGMKSSLLAGIGLMVLFALLGELIIQICALYRFSKYIEDRSDFLNRSIGGMAPGMSYGTTMTRTGGPTAATGTYGADSRFDRSRTIARPPRDETWVASARAPKAPPIPPSPSIPAAPPLPPGGKIPSGKGSTPGSAGGAGYASVYPPTPSQIELREKEKARQKRQFEQQKHLHRP